MQAPTPMTRKLALAAALAATLPALAAPGLARACDGNGREPSELTVNDARASVLCLLNQRRQANGLRKLRGDGRLELAAQRHSASMDARNYFSHSSPGGGSPRSRIQRTGYLSGASSWGIAENILWGGGGRGSPKAAVARWMASPGHRAAILSPSYREIGIGFALGSPTGGRERNSGIYTTTFGYRR